MARKYRNLWPQLVSWENLVEAYRRCRRRKRYKRGAVQFDFHWEANLRQLQQELRDHLWEPGEYYNFRISDPKPRLISAAPFRDRVVHHAVVNVLNPLFERKFIFDSYACRRDKGTHRALKRAQYYLRRHPWLLKTDIVKFFPNIDHQILLDRVQRTVADPNVLQLVERVLESGEGVLAGESPPQWFAGDDLLSALRPKGLPIGNLTSQFLANVMLDPIDHFIKEVLRVPGYIRYSDDLLMFGDSKRQLREVRERVEVELAGIRLRLHTYKTFVSPSVRGVKFLGFRVRPNELRLCQETVNRFNRRRRNWGWQADHGELTPAHVQSSLRAWLAHAANANSTAIRRALVSKVRLRFGSTGRPAE